MFKDLINKNANTSSIIKEIINFNSNDYKTLPPEIKVSLFDLKNKYLRAYEKPAEEWAAILSHQYKKLDYETLIKDIFAIQKLQGMHSQQKDEKHKTSVTNSIFPPKPVKEGSTFHWDNFSGRWLENTAENQKFVQELEKKRHEYLKNKRIQMRKSPYNIIPEGTVDLANDDDKDTLITSTESDMIVRMCDKNKDTLFGMEESFRNIPTKRIYTFLHYENNIPEKYCLDLQLLMDTWKNENDRYRIYAKGAAKIPVSVYKMQDIAKHVIKYNKTVDEYNDIKKTDAKKAFEFARTHGLTYYKDDEKYGVGDYIELSKTIDYMLQDLTRKTPSILLQKIINLDFDNTKDDSPSYYFRLMNRLYTSIALLGNKVYPEIVKIISPYKELQKELEELKLLFATRSIVKKKSLSRKSNKRSFSLDSVPNQNYSCTCTCVSNKNDSSFSTLQNSLLESFTRDTSCDTLSYTTNISPTNSNSVYIVI